ncbi:PspC domain-containing protein [Acinetobacter larvae]|uniref:PspC family transcriptional regulator n=1 Tax=Acinetobacter larvae TaxID=1789224 RepID=A0A1B2M2G2_9GAMM|nr:PspC domain-containing protein [Acinetobacter larvae]AOA59341.1 PspC family transcriptional regulator [Acinetobacter larvae]
MNQVGLYRSQRQKIIAGVMGGIAERFNWNANLLRLVFVAVSILSAGFPGILIYLILWFIMPQRRTQANLSEDSQRPMRTIYENKH